MNGVITILRQVELYFMKLSIVNEYASNLLLQHFQFVIKSPSSFYNTMNLSLPESNTTVSLENIDSETIRISAGEIDGYLYDDNDEDVKNDTSRLSDTILISLKDIRGVTELKEEFCGPSEFLSDKRKIKIEFQHKTLLNLTKPADEYYNVFCDTNDFTTKHVIKCDNGNSTVYQCNGRKHMRKIVCPMKFTNSSSCKLYGNHDIEGCKTLQTTTTSTLCECDICDVIIHHNKNLEITSNVHNNNNDRDTSDNSGDSTHDGNNDSTNNRRKKDRNHVTGEIEIFSMI